MFVLATDSREKRQEKISGFFGTNSSLGPAVHEGGNQSDTPFVERPRLFDLGCQVRPAYMIRVRTFARGSNRWTMAAQHTSRPRPGTSFCLINFLSGSTPPKSAKRKRLPSSPRKKKFENAEKKSSSRRGTFSFFFNFFSNVFFGRFRTVYEIIFLFFSFPCPEGRFGFSSEPALLPLFLISKNVLDTMDQKNVDEVDISLVGRLKLQQTVRDI